MTQAKLLIAAISVLCSLPMIAKAQEPSVNQSGCLLKDGSKLAQFITYERETRRSTEVRLRLQNNTNCTIIVETDNSPPPVLVRRLPNNGIKVEMVTTSEEGVWLPLHYFVQNSRQRRMPEPAYGWGDSVSTYEILAGQSVFFSVPLSHFKKGFDVVVPFTYVWEKDKAIGMGVGGVIHGVYFTVDKLPKEVLSK